MKFLVQNQPCYGYTGGKPWDASKPCLLFIHGAANDHSVWHLQARYFAHHGWNVVAVDLPGHGRSDGSARASIGEYSQWIVAFLENAAIEQAVLVGHSMGSLIALDTALLAPTRVAKLALLGASVPMPVGDILRNAARDDQPLAYDMVTAWGVGLKARIGSGPVPGLNLGVAYRTLLGKARDGVLFTDLSACHAYAAETAALSAMQVPTLLLIGEKDQMTPPKAGHALTKVLPDVVTRHIPDCGHSLMNEAPDAVIDALRDFLR
jgi:pimeloyl-ACP methyl ester carboxylesterase